jgi:uncharacterized protein
VPGLFLVSSGFRAGAFLPGVRLQTDTVFGKLRHREALQHATLRATYHQASIGAHDNQRRVTMTPQERDVIAGIFDRLKQAANQPRDPEADKFIAERLAQQPYAPYAMAQSVYVQEQALINMQNQIEQLQAQVQQLQSQPPQQAQGGFLSGLFGGGAPARPPVPAPQPMSAPQGMQRPMGAPGMAMAPQQGGPAQGGPWAGQQQAPQQAGPWGGAAAQPQRQGGGFMQTAMVTAAGVAGGMVLGNVLMNAFQGSKPPAAAPGGEQSAAAEPASNAGPADGGQAEMQPASYEDPGQYDDGGGNDEWA